ncbi:motility associated factor glycosyltransferase family protein [Robertmurraya korlensis]|uniref:motility associated factor glycosyltransferase family protein n=1 Tax=Robertmurraya korlensis TaxID=519977 RepID=UPI0008244E2C|nr:6-hydroxymethylpterin diphosphokinase MptE-like protein [Robertmurraya korlensis]
MENLYVIKGERLELNEDISILESKSGLPIVKKNGFYLNSRYDPLKESKQIAEREYKKNYSHILFGLPYSYLANELVNKMGSNDFLLIIEPSLKLFELVKGSELFKSLINHPQVFFIVGYHPNKIEEEVRYLVNKRNIGQLEFITSPNYEKVYPTIIAHFKEIILKNARLSLVNVATMMKFGKVWQDNLLNNISNSWKSTTINKFVNKLQCPVIIAASGPSLNKQLSSLKKIKENKTALILAAGSTINPLLNAGIRPDIVVSIDGDMANWRHFEKLDYDDIALFYSVNVHKNIPKHHNGLNVIFNSQDRELSGWVNKVIGEEVEFVYGGASVATFSLYVAKLISSGPICLIGQDLAYTNNLSHASGNSNQKKVIQEENIANKNYLEVEGYYGDTVLTDYGFLSMKKVFEDMFHQFSLEGDKRPYYNCTEGGVNIKGVTNLPFTDFIDRYCGTSYRSEFVKVLEIDPDLLISKENVEMALIKEKDNLIELRKYVKKAIEMIDGVSMESEYMDSKVLKKLDSLDEKINTYSKDNIIYYLIMPLSFRINHMYQEPETETPLEMKRRIIKKSSSLYNGILESVDYTLDKLEQKGE